MSNVDTLRESLAQLKEWHTKGMDSLARWTLQVDALEAKIDALAQERKAADAEPPTPLDLTTLHNWLSRPAGTAAGDAAREIVYLRAELARLREDYQAIKDSYNRGSTVAHDYCHEFKVGRLGYSVVEEAILDARRLREGLKVQEGDVDQHWLDLWFDKVPGYDSCFTAASHEITRHRALVTK